jgi:hypothetical protein
LKKIHRTLPEKLASKFLFQLQENGENYHLMKGKVYMDRILNLLRCSYKSLEIELEETSKPAAASKIKPAKQISVNAAVVAMATPAHPAVTTRPGYHCSPNRNVRKRRNRPPQPSLLNRRPGRLQQCLQAPASWFNPDKR